jgi:hypothetical protein
LLAQQPDLGKRAPVLLFAAHPELNVVFAKLLVVTLQIVHQERNQTGA